MYITSSLLIHVLMGILLASIIWPIVNNALMSMCVPDDSVGTESACNAVKIGMYIHFLINVFIFLQLNTEHRFSGSY